MMKKTNMIYVLVLMSVVSVAFAGVSGPTPVPNPPTFSISSTLQTLCKGETNEVPVTISNIGNTNPSLGLTSLNGTAMQYIELSLVGPKTLTADNGTAYIGRVNPHNSSTVDFPIFVSPNASLITTAAVSVNYYYLTYYSDTETRNLTFEVETCQSPLLVSINPKTLASGTIQNVSIALTNTGNSPLESLYVHFSMPSIDGAIVGSQQAEISALDASSTYSINASVFVSRNASIESFPLNLTATFYDNGKLEQVSNSTSMIPIGGINLLPSGVTLSPSSTAPGGIFSISFILTDIGTSGASAVTATAILPKGFTPFGTNPVYVGDISADSQAPVTLTLVAGNSTKVGSYKIPIKIGYLNSLRQNESTILNITANVTGVLNVSKYSSTGTAVVRGNYSGSGGILLPLLIIAIIVIIVLAYMLMKEKKKHRQSHVK
jgi:hypothetical protein